MIFSYFESLVNQICNVIVLLILSQLVLVDVLCLLHCALNVLIDIIRRYIYGRLVI